MRLGIQVNAFTWRGDPQDTGRTFRLPFAAAATDRIKLGTLVTGVTYRYPGVLIKTSTTLDVLSGGRA